MKLRIAGRGIAGGLLVVTTLLATVFPLLTGDRIAFRDASHFYLPLYDYVAFRTQSEWMPLWNPLDHTGIPLIGEATTAVLYPVRYVLFSAPVPTEWSLNAYLVFHLLLASAGAAWLARRWSIKGLGTVVAAIVYPLSGSVLGLCCNPPFLVGAAYMPFALGALLGRFAKQDSNEPQSKWLRDVVIAGGSLAMMVLGGDPQGALHVVLIALLCSVVLLWKINAEPSWLQRWLGQAGKLSSACCLAALIAAPQIAASIDWSRQSDRTLAASERADLYDFSVPPWHALELFSARPFGELFPINRRVSKLLAGDGRMWTPSLYAGIVVGCALLLRLVSLRSRQQNTFDPFGMVAVTGLLLSFGHFGLVWILQQIPGVFEGANSAIGGAYWWLGVLVPGYDSFRYPAKWLPVFALGAAMITARWLSRPASDLDQNEQRFERRWLVGIASVLALALVAITALISAAQNEGDRFQTSGIADEYWGPLDVLGGYEVIQWSFACSLIAMFVVIALRQTQRRSATKWGTIAWIALISVDCWSSGDDLLPTVSIRKEQAAANRISPANPHVARTLRTQKGAWPTLWKRESNADRALQVAASERAAWFGRWHLAERSAVVNSMVSIRSLGWAKFWRAVERQSPNWDSAEQRQFWKSFRHWLGVEGISHVDGDKVMPSEGLAYAFITRRSLKGGAMARLATTWKAPETMESLVAQLASGDVATVPRVEFPVPSEPETDNDGQLQELDAERYLVQCSQDCLLVRSVLQDGNWRAEIVPANGNDQSVAVSVPVLSSSFLNQATLIPAGAWEVRFFYQPTWQGPSIWACLAGGGMVVTLLFASVVLGMRESR
ncbi:hypothetical protein [Rhodopirellula sp. MGV]|uniref:hypothetical protein n=1 Tax=Rhodopirellula sp. MGV TaxID=2023130 RepID=UPI000B970EFE|nr:hypothetical protein [Rhodopirellula sp. MGV]OYP33913.1 hypothetical protein CGZ80_17155 [Rhodopirellula sp. MGV]PNY34105.1 hypothetical protein C2E31_25235 [Rhodopirellula baltica]